MEVSVETLRTSGWSAVDAVDTERRSRSLPAERFDFVSSFMTSSLTILLPGSSFVFLLLKFSMTFLNRGRSESITLN